jgi:LPXTG-motif cell wall-anchored protein
LATGGEVTVTFGGFTPFEYVQLIIASTPQVIGSGYANAQGFVTISGNLPATLGLGSHTLAVYAPVSGVGFSQPITVSQPKLPATGSSDQDRLLVVALMLLIGGLLLRRRGLLKSV